MPARLSFRLRDPPRPVGSPVARNTIGSAPVSGHRVVIRVAYGTPLPHGGGALNYLVDLIEHHDRTRIEPVVFVLEDVSEPALLLTVTFAIAVLSIGNTSK